MSARLSPMERKALDITLMMSDERQGYAIVPATLAKTLERKGLVEVVGRNHFGEVHTKVTASGRARASKARRPNNRSEKSCGFAIATYPQSMIEDIAQDRVLEEGEEFPGLVTKTGKITDAGWDRLNKDIQTLERNSLDWLKKTFEGARDDGHSDDDLVGSVWYDPGNKAQMELIELASPSPGRFERIDMTDASFGNLAHSVWTGVGDFGQAVLGGAITFFDVDEEF